MWVVYNLYTKEFLFTGTPDECLLYIDLIGGWSNPVDMKHR